MRFVTAKGVAAALVVGLSTAGPTACLSQRILTVRTRQTSLGSEMMVGGQVWLRLRGPGHAAQVERTASGLRAALLAGMWPKDVQVKAAEGGAYELRIKERVLLVVTRQEAAAQKSVPASLAERWAEQLREFVASPYVVCALSAELQVPVGESRTVQIGGTATGALSAVVVPQDLATVVRQDNAIRVSALRAGDGQLWLSTPSDSAAFSLRARHWAALVPPTLSVGLTARLRPEEWREAAKIALACGIRAQPLADVRVDVSGLAAGDSTVRVIARAPDCLPVDKVVRVESAAWGQGLTLPRRVWVSNYPERVRGPKILLRDRLGFKEAVRLLWHHVNNAMGPLWFGVRLWNFGDADATFAWSGAVSGPGHDEVYLGHVATRAYLDLLNRGAAIVAVLRSRSWVELASVRAGPGHIVSGVSALQLLAGGPLVVEVAASMAPPVFASRGIDSVPSFSRLCRFDFPGMTEATASFTVGEPWKFIRIGHIPAANDEGGVLRGNYGVLHWIDVQVSNPTTMHAAVELAVHAPAGAARMVMLLDGQLLDTPLLDRATYYVIHRWGLEAGEVRRATITTMPQAGSNYPVVLILRPARK
ncbi:MAG: hypothetical protein N2512_00895 [Armatimonadetes bacterium]|nr:hypothetical protein [Armatimonadota bacterium]